MKKCVVAALMLCLCSLSFAQILHLPGSKRNIEAEASAKARKLNALAAIVRSPQSTTDCSFNFNAGSGLTSITYCVTANGNIVRFEVPSGVPLVSQEGFGEGYGVCDATQNVSYFDYAGRGDSGNWQNPVVTRSGSVIKVVRTTADGLWTLTQTISLVTGGNPGAKIAMSLKNNSGVTKTGILLRYADLDAGGDTANNFDGTLSNAFGWNSIDLSSDGGPFGLALENVGNPHAAEFFGFAQTIFAPPDPCSSTAFIAAGPQTGIDGSLVYVYAANVPKSKTMSGTVMYRGQ